MVDRAQLRSDLEWWSEHLAELLAKPAPTMAATVARYAAISDAQVMVRTLREQVYPNPCTDPGWNIRPGARGNHACNT